MPLVTQELQNNLAEVEPQLADISAAKDGKPKETAEPRMVITIEESADNKRIKITFEDQFVVELSPTCAYNFGLGLADRARFVFALPIDELRHHRTSEYVG